MVRECHSQPKYKSLLMNITGEYLEWIVIVLIAAEILVAAINIVVDLYAGVD